MPDLLPRGGFFCPPWIFLLFSAGVFRTSTCNFVTLFHHVFGTGAVAGLKFPLPTIVDRSF